MARASLDELLLQYEDYLRQNGHVQWDKDLRESLAVRNVGQELSGCSDCGKPEVAVKLYRPWLGMLEISCVQGDVASVIQ